MDTFVSYNTWIIHCYSEALYNPFVFVWLCNASPNKFLFNYTACIINIFNAFHTYSNFMLAYYDSQFNILTSSFHSNDFRPQVERP